MPKGFSQHPTFTEHAGIVSRDGVDVRVEILQRSQGKLLARFPQANEDDQPTEEWIFVSEIVPLPPHLPRAPMPEGYRGRGWNRTREGRKKFGSQTNGSSSQSASLPPQAFQSQYRVSPSPTTANYSISAFGVGTGTGSAPARLLAPLSHLPSYDGGRPLRTLGGDVPMTEEEYDIEHHKQITSQRNFDHVYFGDWQIKIWYFSPYPLTENEEHDPPTPSTSTSHAHIPGVARTSARSHARTSDIIAGGLQRGGEEKKAGLWVCDRCFKYMADGVSWETHCKKCTRNSPPGKKVYQRGAHTIWEIDGAKEKLYCQNLSLFGKLFIEIKTLFFDCDNFLYYILTDGDSTRDHVLGYFSKEKYSYDDYNLATIIVLPPFQRKGYGMLMIEFSYELSKRTSHPSARAGTPERPLSDLGLRSYLAYWVATIIRFLRRLLSVVPPEADGRLIAGGGGLDTVDFGMSGVERMQAAMKGRRKRAKGFEGEVMHNAVAPLESMNDPLYTSLRTVETVAHPDGSATSHVYAKCTLGELARATGLRPEDTAFALQECGMMERRRTEDGVVVISREMVEKVAKERGVKRMCIVLEHLLL